MNSIIEKRLKVAKIIQNARIEKGWTQQKLGDEVGFSRSTIIRIEAATFSPNADQLYKILNSLDLTLIIENEEI